MFTQKRLRLLCCLFSLFCLWDSSLLAQDSLLKRLDVDLSLRNRYLTPFSYHGPGNVKVHPYLSIYRNSIYDSETYNPEVVQNNPVFHNALQLTLHSRLKISKDVQLYADFLTEQQGFSSGTFNTEKTFFMPMVRVDAGRDFHLFKQDFRIFGSLGTFRNFRLNEGVFIYGYDLQGLDLNFRWKRLRLRYVQINDMSQWIGLLMNEPRTLTLSADSLSLNDRWKLDMTGSFTYEDGFYRPFYGPSLSGAVYHGDNLRFYAEGMINLNDNSSLRDYAPYKGLQDQLGVVAGVHWKHQTPKWQVNARAEFRHYGNEYILNRKSNQISYQGSTAEIVGSTERRRSAFYPLHYMDRPFAQFAFFTDFQQTGYTLDAPLFPDISAASLVLDATYRLPWDFYVGTNLDLNLVFAEGSDPFLYPFYQFSFGWEPAPGNRIGVLVTNKCMDYQLHYPTHQLLRTPFFGLSATRDLPNWKKNSWR